METILCKEGFLIKKNKKSEKIIEQLKEELKVTPFNPYQYNMKKKGKDESFVVYQENDDYISIPKFYGIEKFGIPKENEELIGEKNKLKFKGKLRDYQEPIVKKSLKHLKEFNGGLISVGCGKGKTCMSLYISCKLKVKTLVIVHKTFLLNQWVDRIKQFTNAEIGIIQQKKIDIEGKDIVIGMLQSIAKGNYDKDIFMDFGFIIFDEAHHAPSKYFSKALPIINCKKTLALSATPKRSDKLEKLIYWYLGPLIYKSPVEENKNVLVKMIKYNLNSSKFREYKLPYNAGVNRPKTLTKLCQIKKRNKFIVKTLKEVMIEEGRKILVLSDRIEHLELLKELLDEKQFATSDFYIGGRKQKDLDIAAEAQVILATFSMASEALDIPSLNTLFMVTSRREIEQSVGRILRKKDHPVQPLILDMVDQLKTFVNQSVQRRRFYKKNNYQIKLLDVDDNEILSEEDITNKKFKTFKPMKVDVDQVEFLD
jgi:superfamily II DNA or RNA helicase